MKSLRILAATTATVALMSASAFAADITMRIGHLNPADPLESHSGTMTTIFKSLVETNSNGAIEVQLFPNGQLGKDNEVIQQVREGIVESCISSSGGVAQHYPVVGVFDLPFAFPNIGVATKVIHKDSSFGKKFVGGLEAKTGLKVLGLIDSGGFFAVTNSKRPIASGGDMKGLRIRTLTPPTPGNIISSLGGSPPPPPRAAGYTALQTGVADGQMKPAPIIGFAKFDEVQEYLSLTNHVITPYVWMMNKEFLDGLSAEHRALITWAADVATEAGRAMSRVIEASDKGLPRLAAKMKVNAVSPAEIAKFAAASQPAVRKLIEEKLGQEGTDMLNAMLASIKENM